MRDRGRRGQADRYSGMVRSVRTRARKHMRRRWQWVALGIVVVLAVIAGGALWLYVDTSNRIQTEVEHVQPPRDEGDPFNVLLVGSDSRAGLTEKEQERLAAEDETPLGEITGERADTLIVAHVDPATDRITMVQFPRDLWVPVVGRGRDRINSALLEGKGALVRTVERLTGLDINRYVQINIAGFRDLVDAIDGVDVCVPDPIPFDPSTGLEVKEPGMVHFDGDRALRFVRSRKVFGTGDLERIQNQQRFLSAAIDKITSIGTLINPGRIRALIRTAGENLRIDDRTSLPDLYRIGQRLKTFDPQLYEAYTVPNLGISESPVIRPDRTAMRVLFDAIAANESPAAADGVPSVAPGDVDVAVLNGTFEDGAARAAARALVRATDVEEGPVSISDAHIDNAGRFNYTRSVIRYAAKDKAGERMARLVAAAVPGARVVAGRTPSGVDVAVVVGRRFRTRPIVQVEPIPIPKPGALPRVCRG